MQVAWTLGAVLLFSHLNMPENCGPIFHKKLRRIIRFSDTSQTRLSSEEKEVDKQHRHLPTDLLKCRSGGFFIV